MPQGFVIALGVFALCMRIGSYPVDTVPILCPVVAPDFIPTCTVQAMSVQVVGYCSAITTGRSGSVATSG